MKPMFQGAHAPKPTVDYNIAVQEYMLNLAASDAATFRELRQFLKPEYFDDQLAHGAKFIHHHFDRYDMVPPADLIRASTSLDFQPASLTESDAAWLRQEAPGFARFRATENVILDGFDLLRAGRDAEFFAQVAEAQAIGIGDDGFPVCRLRDLDWRVKPRRWLYGRSLLRGMVSVLGGTGGVGKSSYVIGVGMSVATGQPLLGDDEAHRVHRKGNVCYYNLEDPIDELQRRIMAEVRKRGLDMRQLWDSFLIGSGRDKPITVATTDKHGSVMRLPVVGAMVDFLKEQDIALLVVDPYANSHEVSENDNAAQKIVVDQWRQVADKADCGVWLVHHFRKGGVAGDAESFRGGIALQNGARVMETATTMTADEAKSLSVPKEDRRKYVKIENAKVNLTAAPDECEWYKFEGVPLDNGTEEYPDGDVVGVLARWHPAPPLFGTSLDAAMAALDEIEQGADGEYYQFAKQAHLWVGDVLMRHLKLDEPQAKSLSKEWQEAGVLATGEYVSAKRRSSKTPRVEVTSEGRKLVTSRMKARA